MLWRTFVQWFIASCLGASALNFSAMSKEPVEPPQAGPPALALLQESPLKPVEPIAVAPAALSSAQTPVSVSAAPAQVSPPKEGEGQKTETAEGMPAVEEYRLQPEDVLHITVYEEPDLTTRVRVTGSGEINFPLLGRIAVTGLSVLEIQEKITGLLARDYLVNPQVQVFIETYHSRSVFVTGAVDKPGSYPLPTGKPTTLMEAVTLAGGFTEDAAVNSTRIIRIENGRETTVNVKANDIIKKGDKSKDVEVRPNDVVFVPESFF